MGQRGTVILLIERRKVRAVFAPRYSSLPWFARSAFKPDEPFVYIRRKARFAVFSIADNIDSDFRLLTHDL